MFLVNGVFMLNKVQLIGNLGAAPETRYLPNSDAVVSLSIATSRRWKDRSTGEKKQDTEWHRVVMFRKLAEIAKEYLSKGSQVYIEGRIKTRKWSDSNGIERYSTEVIAETMTMLGSKSSVSAASQQAVPDQSHTDSYSDSDIPFS